MYNKYTQKDTNHEPCHLKFYGGWVKKNGDIIWDVQGVLEKKKKKKKDQYYFII